MWDDHGCWFMRHGCRIKSGMTEAEVFCEAVALSVIADLIRNPWWMTTVVGSCGMDAGSSPA
jgi:hypothetical protein